MTIPGHNTSLAAYQICKKVMDMALDKPGLVYKLKTPGFATNFKQKCYRFRNLVRKLEAERLEGIPGANPQSAYDILVIRQDKEDKRILRFDHDDFNGVLLDPDTGKEIDIDINTDPEVVGEGILGLEIEK